VVDCATINNIIEFTTGCNILPVTSITALFVSAIGTYGRHYNKGQGFCSNDEIRPHSGGRAAS
jgi:hypothetical protein